jgi:peptide/nickel transport system substrate-binding protein
MGKGGHGFTEPSPVFGNFLANIDSVEAIDDDTFVFHFITTSMFTNFMIVNDPAGCNAIEPRELLEAGSTEWQNAVGTGPFILTELIPDSSVTFTKNPNYWGYDERHPENQIPYVDEVKLLCIPDISTALSALRTGQIDWMDGLTWIDADFLEQTNPELTMYSRPWNGIALEMRCDHEPFTDIRVRKAMNMAINREEIAEEYYGGIVSGTPVGWISPMNKGWVLPYEEWPEDVQAGYSYDPRGNGATG